MKKIEVIAVDLDGSLSFKQIQKDKPPFIYAENSDYVNQTRDEIKFSVENDFEEIINLQDCSGDLTISRQRKFYGYFNYLGKAEEKIFEMDKKLIGNLPNEIWKNIEGFDGKYQVSNKGRVKSFINQTERIIGGGINVDGYYVVRLRLENKKSVVKVIHSLVAKAFIDNPKNLPVVNHKDGDKNNYVENLEWMTIRENTLHAFKLGLMNNHNLQKQDSLTDEEIEYIRENYKPMDKSFGLKAMMKKFNLSGRVITNIIKNGSAGNCII